MLSFRGSVQTDDDDHLMLLFHVRARLCRDQAERKVGAVIVELDQVEGVVKFGTNCLEVIRLKR